MLYQVIEKSTEMEKLTLNKKAAKDNFPVKTERAKKLIKKAGLPKEIKSPNQ